MLLVKVENPCLLFRTKGPMLCQQRRRPVGATKLLHICQLILLKNKSNSSTQITKDPLNPLNSKILNEWVARTTYMQHTSQEMRCDRPCLHLWNTSRRALHALHPLHLPIVVIPAKLSAFEAGFDEKKHSVESCHRIRILHTSGEHMNMTRGWERWFIYGTTTEWRNQSTLQATIVSLLEAACVCAKTSNTRDIAASKFHLQICL